MAVDSVRTQFQVIAEAARGCDRVVAGGALQIARRSIAGLLAMLPTPNYPPPKTGGHYSFELTEAKSKNYGEKCK